MADKVWRHVAIFHQHILTTLLNRITHSFDNHHLIDFNSVSELKSIGQTKKNYI